jgi:hypothetical protein
VLMCSCIEDRKIQAASINSSHRIQSVMMSSKGGDPSGPEYNSGLLPISMTCIVNNMIQALDCGQVGSVRMLELSAAVGTVDPPIVRDFMQ